MDSRTAMALNLCYPEPDYILKETETRYMKDHKLELAENVRCHEAVCTELNELYAKKNADYGDAFHLSYLEEGLAMTRIRLGDKFNRFKSLSRTIANDSNAQKVKDESIRDTLIDLANYAIMTVMELDHETEREYTTLFKETNEKLEQIILKKK